MRTKKVCIATNFNSADPAYSLNRVTQDQIKMLNMGGFKPVVIVSDSFEPIEEYKNAEIRKIPIVPCSNSVKKDKTFDEDVAKLTEAFEQHLKDIDVIITHDFAYQPAALKHNIACRKIANKHPEKRWLHWIHSATPPYTLSNLRTHFQDEYLNLIEKPFPNSYYIAFNQISIPSLAKNFNVSQDKVKYVPHPIDVCRFFGFDEQLEKLVTDKRILESDAICAYPIRLDRGKQVEYVIKTMSQLKEFGMKVTCIIVDFHSTGGDKVVYRDELKKLAIDWGLSPEECFFTSEVNESWRTRVPWETVANIQQLCNVYIHPSRSETYSLTTQEAGIAGSVIVLNQDFPPFRSIYGPNAIYRKFSSNWDVLADLNHSYEETDQGGTVTETKYGPEDVPDEQRRGFEEAYHRETAGMIARRLRTDLASSMQIKLRTERSLGAVFKNYLEPLLYVE
jgi:glycosyltransferase involved in cell wall biosynthesis